MAEHLSHAVRFWLADVADRLTTAADLVDFVLRAGDVPAGAHHHKLAAIAAELGEDGRTARGMQVGDVGLLLERLGLARRGLLVSLRFRCSENPDALDDLGVVAEELSVLCEEGMALEARIRKTEALWTRVIRQGGRSCARS